MRESYKKIVNEDLRERAKGVYVPTLLLYGDKDKTTPVAAGKIYSTVIPESKLVVIKGAGHFAFLDAPLQFDEAVEEFLE